MVTNCSKTRFTSGRKEYTECSLIVPMSARGPLSSIPVVVNFGPKMFKSTFINFLSETQKSWMAYLSVTFGNNIGLSFTCFIENTMAMTHRRNLSLKLGRKKIHTQVIYWNVFDECTVPSESINTPRLFHIVLCCVVLQPEYSRELVSKPPNARLFIHLSFLKDCLIIFL